MLPALVSIIGGAALALVTACSLGVALLRKIPAPPEIVLALGAVAESFLVFLLLLVNLGYWYVFVPLGLAACAAALWTARSWDARRAPLMEATKHPLGKGWIAAAVIFGAYGLWYFVNALAPEILADGMTYHLGLPYEYVRLGGFPGRITFYDMVPQGMEMIYTAAFAVGRHSAAKLVEFAFFLATLPLFFRIGRRLGMSDLASLVAAVFYFCAPVAGVTGASSYNDAAGVFFALAAFYLLLVWRDSGDTRYLLPAGALAGFCFAIKVPGVMVAVAAVLFVLAGAPPRSASVARLGNAARVAIGAAVVMAPWLMRNAILTGNPLAPLLNSLFPNPYFHAATERELASILRSFGSVRWWGVPWELAFGDGFAGTFGPLLVVLPLGLVTLRQRRGRWCWAAAVLLAVPWFSNTGARFLMPAVAIASLTLGMVLPRPAAMAAVALQAVLCWPQTIDLRETRYAFRLHEFPLKAALRLEPEGAYLGRRSEDFKLAQIIEAKTPPGAKVLGLTAVANAYLARDVRVTWQSAESDSLFDSLRLAAVNAESLFDWKASWPMGLFQRLRVRFPQAANSECDIDDIRVYSGEELVYTSPNWTVRAWPNSWEAPLALDGNLATRWRTWEPVRAGMYFEIRFDRPQRISSVVLYSHTPALGIRPEVYGLAVDGNWRALGPLLATRRPKQDLRIEATRAIRRAGYRYIFVPTGGGGAAPVGNAMAGQEPEWGLERVEQAGPYYLFRVK